MILTHSGADRLPVLLHTIETVNAQREVACEYVIVDQSKVPNRDALPEHVRHIWLDNSALEPRLANELGIQRGCPRGRRCHEALVRNGFFAQEELVLLSTWRSGVEQAQHGS